MPNFDTSNAPLVSLDRQSSRRLAAKISELCSYIYAAEHSLLTLIREFDEQRGWEDLGFPGCAHWLNFKCGMDMNTARERVRVANALGELPKIDAEFEKGAISYSKVRAITRIADESNEDYLLMIAHHGTAHHVEKLVRKARSVQKLQDPEHVRALHDDRRLDYHYDADGALVIKGRFPAEQGALIVKAIEMAMERQFNDVSAETETPERPPVAARRADALAEVAETYMNSEPVPNSTADRYQVIVHVGPAERHCEHSEAIPHVPAETPRIENGPGVPAETSRRIACDCSLLRVDEDENGEPLSIGRKSRSIPPAIRRALHLRDRGCRFPGCTNDRFVDGHHVKHWADEGETSLDNLVLLCRFHHHLVHEGGFICELTNEGEVIFKDRQGEPLPQWAPRRTIDADDITAWLDRQFFERDIGADTCATHWYPGERMDWNLAVGHLFTNKRATGQDVSAETWAAG